jgi:uncharacterized protein (DUF934 family)
MYMATLIKERRIAADSWRLLEAGAAEIPAAGDVIVPLALWQVQRAQLLTRAGRLGVWLEPNEDPAAIADDIGLFGVIAVNFPKFGDGRGYSTARLLRERYGWKGELRAIGDVLRDHLAFMAACGFDAYALRDDQDPQDALAAFEDFTEAYQASVERPLPLFRRRALASLNRTE